MFAALADPTRRDVLRAVAERGPVTATALAGGLPVMIDRLLGLVKLGITQSADRLAPSAMKRAKVGARPSAMLRSI